MHYPNLDRTIQKECPTTLLVRLLADVDNIATKHSWGNGIFLFPLPYFLSHPWQKVLVQEREIYSIVLRRRDWCDLNARPGA